MNPELLSRIFWTVGIILAGLAFYAAANRWLLARANKKAYIRLNGNRPAVLYFTSPDCVPCKTVQKPAIESLKAQLGEYVEVVEVDASNSPELASQWGVLSVPTTFILDRHGSPRYINHGVAPVRKLQSQLQTLI